MKQKFLKFSMVVAVISMITFFAACKNNNTAAGNKKDTSQEHAVAGNHGEEHIYACPMHPEVTGKEGDTCPKCGMALIHADPPASGYSNYMMQFTTNPTLVEAGKEVTFSLIPKNKANANEQVALDIEHDKKIHLIVVSEDLSYFTHIHPEFGADGSYTVKTIFPSGGKYILYADYKPSNGQHTVDKLEVNASGKTIATEVFNTDKTFSKVDGFTVSLTPEKGNFITKVPLHISGTVTQNGKAVDVNTFENYLGAKAHMVIISLNDKQYLHVHPGAEDGSFDLHTTFDKPGIYRGWIQFQTGGKVHTADFVMNVKEASAKEMEDEVKAKDDMKDMKDMNH